MEVFKTRYEAETAKRTMAKYSVSDMTVKVKDGFAVMSVKDYIEWLKQQ